MENTSGGGSTAAVPAEIDRWNWGAFLLTWIWGIGNRTPIAFLMFVPGVNLVMPFVLGAKGSVWAWRNKRWESVEAFKSAQRKWTKGALAFIIFLIVLVVGMVLALSSSLKHSEAYQQAIKTVSSSQKAVDMLGEPIAMSMSGGSVKTSGQGDGEAVFSIKAKGPKGSGLIYVTETKTSGAWQVDEADLKESEATGAVDLLR